MLYQNGIMTTSSLPEEKRNKADEKLTVEEEADLTESEVNEMLKDETSEPKGSSGPEEKDIAV